MMPEGIETIDESTLRRGSEDLPLPGVVVVFANSAPSFHPLPLHHGRILLGRNHGLPGDDRLSRRHAEIEFDGLRWTISDLQSRNGTFVDGERVDGTIVAAAPRSVRVGRTVMIVAADLRRFDGVGVELKEDVVIGPSLRAVFTQVKRVAASGSNLLVTGESGTGKELAANLFHRSGPHARGPLIAVNCAAIPEGVAERLIFGSKRGAFSGAENAQGYVQAADHGVLFLDELGELDLEVQAKLLRVIDTREVTPLGATSPRRVTLAFCFATNVDLRQAVAADRFRADLFHRLAQPGAELPPLRERPEEIPWLIVRELAHAAGPPAAPSAAPPLVANTSLVEACLTRVWPGNIRELQQQIRRAAEASLAAGDTEVGVEHLDPFAGHSADVQARRQTAMLEIDRESIEAALHAAGGNVAAAARALGLHRTQFYRLLKKLSVAAAKDE